MQVLARGQSSEAPNQCQAALLATTAQAFLQAPHALGAEIFGAGSLVVRCRDEAEMLAMLDALEGQLTAALHLADGQDEALAARLLPALLPPALRADNPWRLRRLEDGRHVQG